MENVIRLLVRFLLVPLGYLAAGIAATIIVLIAWWQFADANMAPQPDGPDFAVLGLVIGGPLLFIVVLTYILVPIAIGILVSEAFAKVDGMRDRLVSVGRYALRGVERPQELFTLEPSVGAE